MHTTYMMFYSDLAIYAVFVVAVWFGVVFIIPVNGINISNGLKGEMLVDMDFRSYPELMLKGLEKVIVVDKSKLKFCVQAKLFTKSHRVGYLIPFNKFRYMGFLAYKFINMNEQQANGCKASKIFHLIASKLRQMYNANINRMLSLVYRIGKY